MIRDRLLSPARPVVCLTRHFFTGLFDLSFLSDSSSMSVPKLVTGICGVFFAFGVILTRVFLRRYRNLWAEDTAAPYLDALLTDHVFTIAVPMWIVAFATVIVGASIFPDESDFRILTPLPVRRRTIFAAKILSVVAFTGVFMAGAQVAFVPLLVLSGIGPWAEHPFPIPVAANLVAGVFGALFAALAVAAIQALLLLLVPRGRLLPVSAGVGSTMLFSLIVALPLIGHLPPFPEAVATNARWLYLFPPAWFAGIERVVLGDLRFAGLALSAIGAIAIAGGIACAAYLILYRHFDRVMVRPAQPPPADQRPRRRILPVFGRPPIAAIHSFVAITLRRSIFHQGVVVTIAAIGAALVLGSLLGVNFASTTRWGQWELLESVTKAPLVLIFVLSVALRAALLAPIEGRANWVFRVTEDPKLRAGQLDAAASVIRVIGVALPVALMLPIQWMAIGRGALETSLVALLLGNVFVEFLLLGWRRIPFTCSYIVGKGTAPNTIIVGFLIFFGFTNFGAAFARVFLGAEPIAAFVLAAVLVAAIVSLRMVKRHLRGSEPLEFEDTLPSETNPLRLSEY